MIERLVPTTDFKITPKKTPICVQQTMLNLFSISNYFVFKYTLKCLKFNLPV